MLVKIRERSKGIVAYFLVGLIAIAFSLWGMDSLFTAMRGDPNEVAKVNSESISQFQVDQVAQQQMRQLQQQGQIDTDQLDMNLLRQFALNQIIQEQLVQQKVQQLNMQVGDRQLERQIVRISSFQDEEGRFQQDRFSQLIAQQGLSPQAFRAQLKQDILAQQLLGGLSASEFILANEVEEFQLLIGQKRDYRYKIIPTQSYLSQVEVTPEEIENFYQQQAQNFQTPEQLRLNYLIFDPSQLAKQFNPSEAELKAEYERYISSLQNQQSDYSAAHILLTYSTAAEKQQAQERLEAVKEKIQAGADFATQAAEVSEDIATAKQGGKLGRIQAGSLNASFEEALFALEQPGDLSNVIETEFGLHLIQLTDKQEPELPAFETLRPELVERVIAQPLRNATSEKLEELTNLSFSSDNLASVAEAADLEVQLSDWLVRGKLKGIWAESKVSKAIFADDLIKDGWLTQPLALADGRYLIAGRETYQPQEQQALEEVSEAVTAELKQQKASELVSKLAQQQLDKLQAQEEVAGDWQSVNKATRNASQVLADINQAAFRLSLAKPTTSLSLINGDSVIIELHQVTQGELSSNEAEVSQLSLALQEEQSYRMQNSFVQQLERDAKIILR
ncbi:SurA N-terminal domain-containing protein [Marinospirillum insulare]|uniref:Periplasmic chaperone PpiD n=1 Tax=Marinospirillum insulare TaxID=217169 RepID=A0ABQ6A3N4_9GAMM|nr:SurA N-terminal domain-containing protein [Marinospirillum insulare]GLR64709.1 peptidylprolyl isomerase [Marinospirillum insulare]